MHQSVLLKESIRSLDLHPGSVMVDGTLGAGGHTELVCQEFGKGVRVFAFDLDADAIERSSARLHDQDCNVTFHQANFKDMDEVLMKEGVTAVDAVLLDLGWSLDQFETGGRGLSFRKDEPLQMTLKKEISETEFSAYDILNTWQEEDIANIIYGYGEERFARRIAREIVEQREKSPIKTTTELVDVIMNAVPSFYKHGRIHPATKTFQALRIAVNDELGNLREVLHKGFGMLRSGGRFSIITFHSLEDRIVKNFFKEKAMDGEAELLTKKPIIPSDEELAENKRSRSAKLRVIRKI